MAQNLVIRSKDDKIKDNLRIFIEGSMTKITSTIDQMPPKQYLEYMFKLMQFVLPRPQNEQPLTPEGQAALLLKKTETTATLIAGGIPEQPVDTEYEEEEPQ